MSFANSSIKMTFAKINAMLPSTREELVNKLASCPIPEQSAVEEEAVIGFSGYNLASETINVMNSFLGGHLYFQAVKAFKKVPAALLNEEIKKQEMAFKATNPNLDGTPCETIPSKERKRIKRETKERMLAQQPVFYKGTHVAIDMTNGDVFIESASSKEIDNIVATFFKATNLEIEPMAFNYDNIEAFDIAKGKSCHGTDATSSDFITWFWYLAEEKGKLVINEKIGQVEFLIEGPLTLSNDSVDEVKGAQITTLNKGAYPQVSSEARAALLIGKKLKKCKASIAMGSMVWSGTVNATSGLAFSGLHMPEGEAMSFEERFMEYMTNIEILKKIVNGLFESFSSATGDEAIYSEVGKWAADREAY